MKKGWLSLREFLLQPQTVITVYILVAIIASLQSWLLPPHYFQGRAYSEYNNYVIFKNSFFHLVSGKNLYVLYPDEQWDLYKYSPAFALSMGLLAHLPDLLGIFLWDLANVLALYFAIRMLPFRDRTQNLLLWFVLLELLTSLQNTQSNGLMAGLFIGAYGCLRNGKVSLAALWLVIATFIKVYGAVGFCLFLFFPGKFRFLLYAALWTILLAVIPVVVTPWPTLLQQYHNWADMMAADHTASYGLSVMGWLHSWFGLEQGKTLISIAGIALFLVPFIRIRMYRDPVYQLLLLAFMLIWVIIFNHKAESPTFIIAVAGVAIWFFARPASRGRNVLLAIVFIFTCLSPTDLFPPYIRQHFFVPYTIKALPCIIAWLVVFADLMTLKPSENPALRESIKAG